MIAFQTTPSSGKPASVPGKISLSLFLAFFFGMGLLFLFLISHELWQTAQTYFWPERPCLITRSEAVNDPSQDRNKPYVFKVEYRYEMNGQSLVSSSYRDKIQKDSSWSKIEDLTKRYPPGSSAICFVNPAHPSEAILQHNSLWLGLALLIPLVFVALGGGGIWFTWRAPPPSKITPLSAQGSRPFARWMGTPFFGVFLLVGVGGTVAMSAGLLDLIHSKSWIEVPCTVESSRVLTHDGDDGDTYSVDVLYRYSFQDKTYHSNRYSFMGGSDSGYKSKAAIVSKLPPGIETLCYVDPDSPSKAVLRRGWSWGVLIILVPILFILVGMGGIYFSLRPGPAVSVVTRSATARTTFASSQTTPTSPVSNGPLVMKPKASAWAKMFGAALIALFWNGIISIFIFQAVDSWRSGHPDWFLMLFMIPFVAVGLALIGSIFYFFLCLWNPIAKLALNPPVVALGEHLRLGWGLDGKTERIQNLRITLEGREEATYRRGTRSYTDKSTFFRQIMVDLTDPRQIVQGMAEIEIPADSMHSLSASNNKIIWTITLQGSIPRWPDVKEEFELAVLPQGGPV